MFYGSAEAKSTQVKPKTRNHVASIKDNKPNAHRSDANKTNANNEDGVGDLHVFCNIIKYMEHSDPQLYNVVSNMCLFPAFSNRRGGSGVTFLFPRGKLRDNIIRLAYSKDKPRDAYTMLSSFIIRTHVADLNSFTTTPLTTNNNDELKVTNASSSSMTLSNGLKIGADPEFRLLHPNTKYAVYNIISGSPTVNKSRMSLHAGTVTGSYNSTKGAYEGGAPQEYKDWESESKGAADIGERPDVRNRVIKYMLEGNLEALKTTSGSGAAKGKLKLYTRTKNAYDSLITYAAQSPEKFDKYKDQLPDTYMHAPFAVAWVIPQSVTNPWSIAEDGQVDKDSGMKLPGVDSSPDPEFVAMRQKAQNWLKDNVDTSLAQKVMQVYEAFANKTIVADNPEITFEGMDYNIEGFATKKHPAVAILSHHESMNFTSQITSKALKDMDLDRAHNMLVTAKMVYLGKPESLWITNAEVNKSVVGTNYELLCLLLNFIRSQYFLYRRCCVKSYTGKKKADGGRPDSIEPFNSHMDNLDMMTNDVIGTKF